MIINVFVKMVILWKIMNVIYVMIMNHHVFLNVLMVVLNVIQMNNVNNAMINII